MRLKNVAAQAPTGCLSAQYQSWLTNFLRTILTAVVIPSRDTKKCLEPLLVVLISEKGRAIAFLEEEAKCPTKLQIAYPAQVLGMLPQETKKRFL